MTTIEHGELLVPDLTRSPVDAARPGSTPARTMIGAALVTSAGAGLLSGVATSWLQTRLPAQWSQLANSGAVWTVVAFAVAALCAGPKWLAALTGGLTLVGEVAGYYLIACPLRDIPTTLGEQVLWTVAALWVGPAAGYAAWCWRRGGPAGRVVSSLAVAGMIAGEAIYEIDRLGYGLFGRAELFVASVTALLALVLSRAGWGARLLAIVVGGSVLVSTAAVYVQSVLM